MGKKFNAMRNKYPREDTGEVEAENMPTFIAKRQRDGSCKHSRWPSAGNKQSAFKFTEPT